MDFLCAVIETAIAAGATDDHTVRRQPAKNTRRNFRFYKHRQKKGACA
jgi:hypothetical protein